MPKKTRKQKILAQQRRQSPMTHVSKTYSSPITTNNLSESFQFHLPETKKKYYKVEDTATELGVIKGDLAKTLFLAFIAVTVEITIYWLVHNK